MKPTAEGGKVEVMFRFGAERRLLPLKLADPGLEEETL